MWTWGIPPTHLDRDPFRDRVRGLEYDDPPPTSEHLRGYPHPVPVFGLRRRLHRGNRFFLWKMGGYPHSCAMRCPPPDQSEVPPQPPPRGRPYSDQLPPRDHRRGYPTISLKEGGIPSTVRFAPVPPNLRVEFTSQDATLDRMPEGGMPPLKNLVIPQALMSFSLLCVFGVSCTKIFEQEICNSFNLTALNLHCF